MSEAVRTKVAEAGPHGDSFPCTCHDRALLCLHCKGQMSWLPHSGAGTDADYWFHCRKCGTVCQMWGGWLTWTFLESFEAEHPEQTA